MALYYNKSKLVLLMFVGALLAATCSYVVFGNAVTSGGGRYRLLQSVLGPDGTHLLLGLSALFFAFCSLLGAARLRGGGIAVEITDEGVLVHDWLRRRILKWKDVRSLRVGFTGEPGGDDGVIHIDHAPGMSGLLRNGTQVSVAHASLAATGTEVVAWVNEAELRVQRYRRGPSPSVATIERAAMPAKGFGRRARSA